MTHHTHSERLLAALPNTNAFIPALQLDDTFDLEQNIRDRTIELFLTKVNQIRNLPILLLDRGAKVYRKDCFEFEWKKIIQYALDADIDASIEEDWIMLPY